MVMDLFSCGFSRVCQSWRMEWKKVARMSTSPPLHGMRAAQKLCGEENGRKECGQHEGTHIVVHRNRSVGSQEIKRDRDDRGWNQRSASLLGIIPTIEKDHRFCGLPSTPIPLALNWPVKLTMESIPGRLELLSESKFTFFDGCTFECRWRAVFRKSGPTSVEDCANAVIRHAAGKSDSLSI